MQQISQPAPSKLVDINSYASAVIRVYSKFKHDPTRLIALMESIDKMDAFMKQEREREQEKRQLKLAL